MHVYTIDRLILSIPALLLGITIIFFAVRFTSGSPALMAANRAGESGATPKQEGRQLAKRMNTDEQQ